VLLVGDRQIDGPAPFEKSQAVLLEMRYERAYVFGRHESNASNLIVRAQGGIGDVIEKGAPAATIFRFDRIAPNDD